MKKVNVMRLINQVGFKIQKHSPEILLIGGVTGVVGAAVMACMATTKISEITEPMREDLEKIHDCMKNTTLIESGEYSEADGKNDLKIVYAKNAVKFAGLYGPSVIIGAVSITAILASNNVLKKRNVALAAALTTVDKSFKEYRNRVSERFGADVEKEIRYNIKAHAFEETETDAKGKEKKVAKTAQVSELEGYSCYAKFFDASSKAWEKNADFNRMFLQQEEDYQNAVLRSRGHVFLNEVYERLGLEPTKAGQVVGWKLDNPDGDNFISFGIFETNKANRDFVNGFEPVILLDFNVDGNIWDAM